MATRPQQLHQQYQIMSGAIAGFNIHAIKAHKFHVHATKAHDFYVHAINSDKMWSLGTASKLPRSNVSANMRSCQDHQVRVSQVSSGIGVAIVASCLLMLLSYDGNYLPFCVGTSCHVLWLPCSKMHLKVGMSPRNQSPRHIWNSPQGRGKSPRQPPPQPLMS